MTRKISEFMHSPVRTIGAGQHLHEAKKEMYELGIRHLPVLDGGRCIGMLSDRDVKLVYSVDGHKADNVAVRDACACEVYQVPPDALLADVAAHMAAEQIGSAVVVDQGRITGIFTVVDACRALAAVAS